MEIEQKLAKLQPNPGDHLSSGDKSVMLRDMQSKKGA